MTYSVYKSQTTEEWRILYTSHRQHKYDVFCIKFTDNRSMTYSVYKSQTTEVWRILYTRHRQQKYDVFCIQVTDIRSMTYSVNKSQTTEVWSILYTNQTIEVWGILYTNHWVLCCVISSIYHLIFIKVSRWHCSVHHVIKTYWGMKL
jgi:hypothetical protein